MAEKPASAATEGNSSKGSGRGTGKRIALELLVGCAAQALLRVSGEFTLLGFLDKFAQGVVVAVLLLPLLILGKDLNSDWRDLRQKVRGQRDGAA